MSDFEKIIEELSCDINYLALVQNEDCKEILLQLVHAAYKDGRNELINSVEDVIKTASHK